MAQAVLLRLLLVDGLRVLRFGGRQFAQARAQTFRFAVQFARLARQHLPHDATHLLANFRVTPRLGRLALQRTELLFHFHNNVIHARQVQLGRFQLGFAQTLLGFEFRDARGFFDDGAAFHRLGGQNLSDAALFDDRVGIGTEAHTHKHFLNIAQTSHASVNQVLALPAAVQPPADHHFARLGDRRRFLRFLLFLRQETCGESFRRCLFVRGRC